MKIWHISDTHGYHEMLHVPQGVDLVIHSGDASNLKSPFLNEKEFLSFWSWFEKLPIKYKVYVPGNHDTFLEHSISKIFRKNIIDSQYVNDIYLLINDYVTIENLKIWGSPVTPKFGNWAFMRSRDKTNKLWQTIPDDTDIIVTHGPPKYILDLSEDTLRNLENCGDSSLFKRVKEINPKYHMFGHIHNFKDLQNSGTKTIAKINTIFSNGAMVTDGKFGEKTYNGTIFEII